MKTSVKNSERVIGYIHSDHLEDTDKELMTKETLDYFDNYVSPGWLKYRKICFDEFGSS